MVAAMERDEAALSALPAVDDWAYSKAAWSAVWRALTLVQGWGGRAAGQKALLTDLLGAVSTAAKSVSARVAEWAGGWVAATDAE